MLKTYFSVPDAQEYRCYVQLPEAKFDFLRPPRLRRLFLVQSFLACMLVDKHQPLKKLITLIK